MGWLIYDHVPRDIRGEIHRICSGAGEHRRIYPLQSQRVGDVWYVAVRAEFKDPAVGRDWVREMGYVPNPDGSYVFAAIILTSIEDGTWGYKDMDETCGPVEDAAPKAILDLLSPTTRDYAVNWRARCRERLAVVA